MVGTAHDFLYRSRELYDPKSGLSVVSYAELAAKAVELLIVEVYCSYCLW